MLTTFSGRRPSQNEYELREFIALLNREGVTQYCEIGARHGDTFHEIAINLPEKSKVLAFDLPGGLWGTTKSAKHLKLVTKDLRARGYDAAALFGDSQTDASRRLIAARGPWDCILIDGDHTLPGVTADWNNYGDMARMIAFHDIVGEGQAEKVHGNPVEVPILWASLKQKYRHVEFIAPGSSMGIGVLWTA